MQSSRRSFLRTSARLSVGATAISFFAQSANSAPAIRTTSRAGRRVTVEELDRAAARPVLDIKGLREPVIIESIELLRKGRDHFVRVRSKDGAEGISLDNGRADVLRPILQRLIIPYFLGKDARDLEAHLFEVYRLRDNYKFQGLALWCPVAWVEFAILDMLGRITGKPLGDLLGGVIRKTMPFYIASGRRDTTPEQEVDYLKGLIEETGAKSIKYRVGGRMSRNADASPGRTERLIPLTRKVFGDKMAIHADANSSYDAKHAIPVGRLLEDIGAVYFEEPCPFDDFSETKKVTDALRIPVALGEQEFSHARFKEQIRERVADIAQPDLHYYGGLIRSIRVARMAELAAMPTTPHLSGGFGFVYSLHFASCVREIGPWQEYKEGVKTYGQWFNPPLRITDGAISIPQGPGVGIANPQEVLRDAEVIRG
jgi:L-alanine-DL-glutamate epimerase-like enolase superfamily enzyme